ncbi:MAG: ribosomal-processing cysteine protease Prp [Clostridia bacterium]|nr:ribosomal-processing cysteine protease Prp [Clostridia bacterium]
MIKARFFTDGDFLTGFEIKGHSGYSEMGSDIICASVSSAAFMAANTITEILGMEADIDLNDDGFFKFIIEPVPQAQTTLRGLKLHLEALSQDYPENIKLKL